MQDIRSHQQGQHQGSAPASQQDTHGPPTPTPPISRDQHLANYITGQLWWRTISADTTQHSAVSTQPLLTYTMHDKTSDLDVENVVPFLLFISYSVLLTGTHRPTFC